MNQKITYFEGLRGLCCFIVIIDHFINVLMPSLRYTGLNGLQGDIQRFVAWSPLNIIYSGLPSVYIFFILSGFVLSYKFNMTKNIDLLTNGVVKRYFRLILPVAASMLFMFITYKTLHLIIGSDLKLSFLAAMKEAFITAPFETGARLNNTPLWTISFEIFGSFLVFALLAIFGKSNIRLFVYIICFIFSFNSFYCMFIFGLIMSEIASNYEIKINKIIVFLMFIIGLVLITTPYLRPNVEVIGGIYKYIPHVKDNVKDNYGVMLKIGCPLIFISIMASSSLKSLFDKKVFQFLGRISFSAYILHVTVRTATREISKYMEIEITFPMFLILLTLSVVVIFYLSLLFEKYIDIPSIKLTNKWTGKLVKNQKVAE